MSRPIIGTARFEQLLGDPAAAERGRWVVEAPGVGYLGILEAAPDDTARVSTLLRELLTMDGVDVDEVTVDFGDPWAADGGAVVTAYAAGGDDQ